MGAFCGRLKLCSTSALDCQIGQNKGGYHQKELLLPTHHVGLSFRVQKLMHTVLSQCVKLSEKDGRRSKRFFVQKRPLLQTAKCN